MGYARCITYTYYIGTNREKVITVIGIIIIRCIVTTTAVPHCVALYFRYYYNILIIEYNRYRIHGSTANSSFGSCSDRLEVLGWAAVGSHAGLTSLLWSRNYQLVSRTRGTCLHTCCVLCDIAIVQGALRVLYLCI